MNDNDAGGSLGRVRGMGMRIAFHKIYAWVLTGALLPALAGCEGLPQFDPVRIIRYLLSPIMKTVEEAGRER